MNEAEIKNKMLSLEEKIFAEKLPEEMEIWNNKLLITYSKKLKDIKVLDLIKSYLHVYVKKDTGSIS